jgi:hypothetical protein
MAVAIQSAATVRGFMISLLLLLYNTPH